MPSLRQTLRTRRQLRRPSGFRFAIAESIGQLHPEQWDAVTAGQSWFFSRGYLGMLEAVLPEQIEPRYALVTDEQGRPVAGVVMQWAEVDGNAIRRGTTAEEDEEEPNPLRRLADKLAQTGKDVMTRRLRDRVLVCGNLLTYGNHALAVAPDVDPSSLWPAVAEVLYRVRRAEKLSGQAGFVLVKDVTPAHLEATQILRHLSYRSVETEPNMVLPLAQSWQAYDDYLNSLASKYRSAVRQQILNPVSKAGLAVRRFEPTEAMAPRLHDLYLQVHKNAAVRPFTLHPAYFPALARAAGERVRYSGVFAGEQLLGFIATLLDGKQAVGYHIGFDREASAEHPLYLRLLHASIEDSIQMGAYEISFGRTALEPKARLGAKPQPMHVWVRHRQPVVNKLVTRLLGLVHHEEAPQRNPFKGAASG